MIFFVCFAGFVLVIAYSPLNCICINVIKNHAYRVNKQKRKVKVCTRLTVCPERVNIYKNEEFVTNTTTASKYIPKRSRICINENPPSQIQIYLVKVLLDVSVVK